ncbi:holo-ACP synthase AcpS [Corynebacterium pseudodiphtheriticum]|uniref:holo-ACP synthase AcpS n=1 Tax=Corynebacterium pseudodiphtheriticum TaxID=37637 RepID=UPI0020BEE55C|nr:holo-ACP synthase [Corynebacterium pseudodiphtheriticum]UQV54589.1 holo-ACP synthase [Corynebacterium pseudodiphtheriticum]
MQISIGTDLVHVPGLREQLEIPGSRFRRVFSDFEWRSAQASAHGQYVHLAGRWAAKEAFLKAWAQARYGSAPWLREEDIDWSALTVRPDRWGRLALDFAPDLAHEVTAAIGQFQHSISISHDGDYATASCVLYY